MLKKVNKNKQNRLYIFVQILLITTIVSVCLTLSKYKKTIASDVTTIVALNEFSTTIDTIKLNELIPGDKSSYRFKIQNFDINNKQKVAEVGLDYTVQIKSGSYLPLNFELHKIEDGNLQEENLLKNTGNITDKISFEAGVATENEYMFIIKWDENEKNYKYSDEIDFVQILVNCVQAETKK